MYQQIMKLKRVKQWYKDFNSSIDVAKSGLKFVILIDNVIVCGASSYLIQNIDNNSNIEIKVATYAENTAKQLTLICVVTLVLTWVVQQITAYCAIDNLTTVKLISQLDLTLNIPYQTYVVCNL